MAARQQGALTASPVPPDASARPAWRRAALAGACLALALLAQWALDRRLRPDLAGGLAVAAALAFGAGSHLRGLAKDEAPRPLSWSSQESAACVSLTVLGVLAFWQFAGNRFSAPGLIAWLPGFVLLAMAAWDPGTGHRLVASLRRHRQAGGVVVRWHHLALLGAMGLAAFLRLYRIAEIPLEMGCDLPHNYDNVRQILAGEAPIFFPSHPGREGLFFYLTAPLAALLGLNHTTIKVASALVGVLTVPALYLLGRELCDRETGLVAAAFLAVSHWHVILTRVGYRASLLPLVLALAWLCWARGMRTGGRVSYVLGGLFLGLGFYTYNAAMAAPLLVVLLLLGEVLAGRGRRLAAHGPGLALLAVTAAYVLIPLARYAYDDPFQYTYRVATRLTDLERPLPVDLAGTLFGNIARALAMFTYQGDAVFITNIAFRRQLGYMPAVGFMLGIGWSLWRWRDGGLAILSGLGVMLLPSFLALAFPHEVPSAIRSIGALPPAMLLAAVGLVQARRVMAAALPLAPAPFGRVARVLLVVGAVVALAGEARATYVAYFRDYVRQQPDGNYSISLEMARAIDAFGDSGRAYILAAPHWYDGNAVRAQLGRGPEGWDLELAELLPGRSPLDGQPGKVMVIVHPANRAAVEALSAAFQRGMVLDHKKYDGTPAFSAFYGER